MKYVYLHINESGVFYVGCGSKKRAKSFGRQSPLWQQVAHTGYSIWIVEEFKNKQDAWELEKELIAYFKPSCNKAKGGPGSTGCTHTLEAREKISVSHLGESHPRHKLTKIQVLSIREDTRILRLIAIDHGITPMQVSYIRSRKSWSHV